MQFVIAQRNLAALGGSETFVLTIAEHLGRLGHEVVVHGLVLGVASGIANERAIHVVGNYKELPEEVDATIALDRVMAIDLARRYPAATRFYAMHNADEPWLPPPEPGVVSATLAPNDRFAVLARGCVGAGEVIRIRQPVDLRRFSPRGWACKSPRRVLLLGNYLQASRQRVEQLQQAWSKHELEWHRVGGSEQKITVAEEIAKADIVVGYGRSILEAMACGRPAYVHDHSGSDGWVTAETYARLEADGFAGTGVRSTANLDQLEEDLRWYDPSLGRVGQDLARTYHDARVVCAAIVDAVERRLGPRSHLFDPNALRAMRNLAESQLRAELSAESYRLEAKYHTEVRRAEQESFHKERCVVIEESQRQRSEIERLRSQAHHNERELARLRSQGQQQRDETERLSAELRAVTRSRRFMLMQIVFRPLDMIRSELMPIAAHLMKETVDCLVSLCRRLRSRVRSG